MSAYEDILTLSAEERFELAFQRLAPFADEVPTLKTELRALSARWSLAARSVAQRHITAEDFGEQVNLVSDRLRRLLEDHRVELSREPDCEMSEPAIGLTAEDHQLEKLIGAKSHLQSVAWLTRGVEAARAVCRIIVSGAVKGTGFLISGHRVVTNEHLLRDESRARGAIFEFNYQDDLEHHVGPVSRYRYAEGTWRGNRPYDCAVLRLVQAPDAPPLDQWGALQLRIDGPDPMKGDYVPIIQHPSGGLKQISVTENRVLNVFDHRLQYSTDTLPGSSGSPVFDEHWDVIAVHHAGGNLRSNGRGDRIYANQGILSRYVVQALGLGQGR